MRKQRHGRRARLALLTGVAAFALLQVGTALVIEHWVPILRDPYYGAKLSRLRKRFKEAPADARRIVFLGSSRVLNGFKCDVFDNTAGPDRPVVSFNFGIPGAGPMTQYLTLRRLLNAGVRPDRVLIEIMPAMLDTREDSRTHWVPGDWLSRDDLEMLQSAGLPTKRLWQEWRTWWAVPWYTHRFVALTMVAPRDVPRGHGYDAALRCDPGGYSGNMRPPEEARARRAAQQRKHYADYLGDLHTNSIQSRALAILLELCRREGIEATLVLMPEGDRFRALYSRSGKEQLDTLLRTLQQRFHVPLVNAHNWVPEDGFVDGHHLLDSGATIFSRRLVAGLRATPPADDSEVPKEFLAGIP